MSDFVRIENTDIVIIDGDRGINYPSKNEFYDNEYCLFLDAGNITENGFDFTETHFITKEKDELLKKGKLQRNDIVMMTRGSVGNVALYDEIIPYKNIRINSGMIIIRCQEEFKPLQLYYMLKSQFVQKQIADMMSGSV
ncbi:MAG: restriction endonuclease subunit S [Eubacterium sp.]|nr:restriction endonuclease subunit S [Eubacterium sp.]